MTNPLSPPAPGLRARNSRLAVVIALVALIVLALVVGAPAWAASGPVDVRQGTVPPPPPGSGDDDDRDDDDNLPDATPTPPSEGAAPPAAEPETAPQAGPEAGAPAGGSLAGGLTAVVTAPRLNVRSGPGLGFGVLGQALQDQLLTIQYRNTEGTWWYICCADGTRTSGWVSAALVRPNFSAAEAAALALAPNLPAAPAGTAPASALRRAGRIFGHTGVVAVPRLNLRSQPTTSGAILGRLLQDETVQVLGRDATGSWWYVCCVAGTTTEGWASATFITPSFARATANQRLSIFDPTLRALLPTPTPRPGSAPQVRVASTTALTGTLAAQAATGVAIPRSTGAQALAATQPATTTLGVLLWQEPPFVGPGEPLDLRFVISNTGTMTATAIEVRDELAQALALGSGTASGDGLFGRSRAANGSVVFTLRWPELAPGAAVTATVGITVSAELTNGTVIDTLAAVGAANAPAKTTGVSIGLPPVTLPDFR